MVNHSNHQAKLTNGSIGKHLINMTIPMLWGIFAMIAFNLIDTFFVSQLGTQALAAISFTFPIVMIIGSVAMGLGVGASSVISRAIGRGDLDQVRRLTTDSLILALLIVAGLVGIGITTIDPLFRLLGAGPDLRPLIYEYMIIWYSGVLFVIVPMVGNNALRATGDSKSPAMIMIVGAVINASLDPIMIFGLLGFPRMELQGAALATVIARSSTLAASMWILHNREKMLLLSKTTLTALIKSWQAILVIGLPSATSNLIMPLSMAVITAMVAKFGKEPVAALGIVIRVEAFALMVVMALSSILGPFMGQNWGAKRTDRVLIGLSLSNRFVMLWGLGTALLLLIFHLPIIHLFNQNQQVVKVAGFFLCLVPWTYGLEGLRFISNATFNALGKPRFPIILTVTKMLMLYIPLAWIGGHFFGIKGIILAAAFANFVTGLLALALNHYIIKGPLIMTRVNHE